MNALKHSGASNVEISLKQDGDRIRLKITDDGVGFDTNAPGPEGHFGLAMMRERAQVAGADFAMTSSPGQGTTLSVGFPDSWLETPMPDEEDPDQDSDGQGGSLLPVAEPAPKPQSVPA